MPKRPLQTILCMLISVLIAGCGFALRGTASLPFETIYIQAPETSQFNLLLRRTIASGSTTRIVNDPKSAVASVILISELREKSILTLTNVGRVREFQLRYRISYRITDQAGLEVAPATEIALNRELTYSDQNTLAKESEENMLYRDMQNDAIQQLVRRLQILRPTTIAPTKSPS